MTNKLPAAAREMTNHNGGGGGGGEGKDEQMNRWRREGRRRL
jgi:hypothetical protein